MAAYGTRIGTDKSPVHTRSSCESCGHIIKPIELIPVLSWLALRGQCSACGAPLFKRYILTEASFAILGWLYATQVNFQPSDVTILVSISLLVVCVISDFEKMLLPMPPMIIVFCLGLLYTVFEPALELHTQLLVGGLGVLLLAIPALAYFAFRRIHGFGEGDYYLMAAIGVWCSTTQIAEIFYLGIVTCLLAAVANAIIRGKKLDGQEAFPLGAFLAMVGVLHLIQLLFMGVSGANSTLTSWVIQSI